MGTGYCRPSSRKGSSIGRRKWTQLLASRRAPGCSRHGAWSHAGRGRDAARRECTSRGFSDPGGWGQSPSYCQPHQRDIRHAPRGHPGLTHRRTEPSPRRLGLVPGRRQRDAGLDHQYLSRATHVSFHDTIDGSADRGERAEVSGAPVHVGWDAPRWLRLLRLRLLRRQSDHRWWPGTKPHGPGNQRKSGRSVDPHELQPGDLVFFQNTHQAGLSHVGIYVGHGQFISTANESTGVILSNLWDSYWGPRFETARRIG